MFFLGQRWLYVRVITAVDKDLSARPALFSASIGSSTVPFHAALHTRKLVRSRGEAGGKRGTSLRRSAGISFDHHMPPPPALSPISSVPLLFTPRNQYTSSSSASQYGEVKNSSRAYMVPASRSCPLPGLPEIGCLFCWLPSHAIMQISCLFIMRYRTSHTRGKLPC
jgi:hypothetical protein